MAHLFIVGITMCMSIETLILHYSSCCLYARVGRSFVASKCGFVIDPILFSNKCRIQQKQQNCRCV